jgi:hypothetical protein
MSKLLLAGAVVVAFFVGGAAGWLLKPDTDTRVVSAPNETAPSIAVDATPAQEMQALITSGRKLVFHVRYTTQKDGASAELELWNSPPKARRDINAITNAGRGRTAEIRLEKEVIRCVETEKVPWQCAPLPASPASNDPGDLTLGAIDSLEGSETSVRDESILNTPVRCFTITPPKDTNALKQELCMTKEGIPLKVDGGDGAVVATVFERAVDDSAFNPPAKPLGTG